MSTQFFPASREWARRGVLLTVGRMSATAIAHVEVGLLELCFDELFFATFLQGNNGLKPKENEFTSKPWHWPINYQVGPGARAPSGEWRGC